MTIGPGSRLGSYEILDHLGSGGVGDVYRARDVTLGRQVAVKVLRSGLADRERLERFEREARTASSLSHPNIVHIYNIGNEGGTLFIAMELATGRTLRQLIAEGPMPMPQILQLAPQLADALAKAHDAGVVHRDLKPENVVVNEDGLVKILDFGLAKLTVVGSDPEGVPASVAGEPLPGLTETGMILGTAGYMAPEQVRGEVVDARADHFALGLILFEMAAGRRAFEGPTAAETLVAILRQEVPSLAELRPDVPAPLEWIVQRCLAKEASDRYGSSGELADDLRQLRDRYFELSSSGQRRGGSGWTAAWQERPGRRPWGRWLAVVAITGLTVATVSLAVLLATRDRSEEGKLSLLASADGLIEGPDLSADGKMLAYVAKSDGRFDLFVRRVAGGPPLRLTDDAARESAPDFSPDGEWIAFGRRPPGGEAVEIVVIPAFGGEARTVLAGGLSPDWSPEGRRLAFIRYRPGETIALASVGLDGGRPRILLEADSDYPFLSTPAWSPDGRVIALRRSVGGAAGEIWEVPADGGEPRRLTEVADGVFAQSPAYVGDGRALVYVSNRSGATNLWQISASGGEPRQLTRGVGPDLSPSVSDDGRIALLNTRWRYTLRLHDLESGTTEELASHVAYIWGPAFSPDGGRIVFSRAEPDGAWHLWSVDLGGAETQQLTSGPSGELYPRFERSGVGLLYTNWSRPRSIFRLPLPSGPVEPLTVGHDDSYGDPSPDGRHLAFTRHEDGMERILVRPLIGGEARPLTRSRSTLPRWSPNGRWIAFTSDRSTMRGISLARPDGSDERRLTKVGGWPVWWPDSRRLGYLVDTFDGSQEIRTLDIEDGRPSQLLAGIDFIGTNHPFDISPDGRMLATSNSVPTSSEIWLLELPRGPR